MATQFKRPSTFAGAAKHRSPRVRFAPMRQRFMNSLRAGEPGGEPTGESSPELAPDSLDGILPRFAVVRQGYDCLAVDEYVTEVERELAQADRELVELRARA